MSRNLKRENLKKLAEINVNGFWVDIPNYISNPSYEYEYPMLKKKVDETPEKLTYVSFSYFKHYDGSGEYIMKRYSVLNDGEMWHIVTVEEKKALSESRRFSMAQLKKYAAEYSPEV